MMAFKWDKMLIYDYSKLSFLGKWHINQIYYLSCHEVKGPRATARKCWRKLVPINPKFVSELTDGRNRICGQRNGVEEVKRYWECVYLGYCGP